MLLAAGSDADTAALRQAVENSSDDAFSPDAKLALLYKFWDKAGSRPAVPDNFLHAYVMMTARYFLDARDVPPLPGRVITSPARGPRWPILHTHIPWLWHLNERSRCFGRPFPLATTAV